MEKVFIAVDLEWVSLAYGDLLRTMRTPEEFCDLIRVSAERFGVKWPEEVKLAIYDAPRDPARGAIHQELMRRGFELKLGHVMERRQYNGSVSSVQKGVDVMLTVDSMIEMHEGAKTFILLTSDSDFVPLLQYARFAGVKTVVIGRSGAAGPLTKAADIACSLATGESE